MSAVKERIMGALMLMREEEAEIIWDYIRGSYRTQPRSWDDIEETEPTGDELEIINKYLSGDPEYEICEQ